MSAFYNDNDLASRHVLSWLQQHNMIAPGRVDGRSIKDIQPDEISEFTQAHFFAGAGLWSVAARLAGWPDDKPLWSGSCPCQPFSVAGKGGGINDERHLWPDLFRLISACRPPVCVGEQVAGAAGEDWFDGVRSDLAREGYEARVVVLPSLAVDAPNIRQRIYWVALADADSGRQEGRLVRGSGESSGAHVERPHDQSGRRDGGGGVADAIGSERNGRADEPQRGSQGRIASGRVDAGVEHTESIGRREGWPEPIIRGGRSATTSTDVSSHPMGDSIGSRLEGHAGHDGGADGRQEPHRPTPTPDGGNVANANSAGRGAGAGHDTPTRYWNSIGAAHGRNGSFWSDHEWIICHDGKARRTKPGLRLLVDGMAGRIHLWRLAGNSINPVLAAEVLASILDIEGIAA